VVDEEDGDWCLSSKKFQIQQCQKQMYNAPLPTKKLDWEVSKVIPGADYFAVGKKMND
jgi:hypothetical protein